MNIEKTYRISLRLSKKLFEHINKLRSQSAGNIWIAEAVKEDWTESKTIN